MKSRSSFLTTGSRRVTTPHPPECCQFYWHPSCIQIIFSSSTPGHLYRLEARGVSHLTKLTAGNKRKKDLRWRKNKCTKKKSWLCCSCPLKAHKSSLVTSWRESSEMDWERLCVLPLSLGRTLGQSCWVDHSLANQLVYLWKCLIVGLWACLLASCCQCFSFHRY